MSTPGPPLDRRPGSSTRALETTAIDTCYLAGESVAMRRMRSQLQRIAPYIRTALITGERGTGKESVARVLHARGPGANGPFVVWEAVPLAEKLMDEDHSGILLEAHGGTLFLAKIGAVPLAHQPTLLRILQHQEQRTQRCDLRIMVSNERDLRTSMATGQFREDLYQRIAGVEIKLIPLRKRQEDLAGLTQVVLQGIAGRGITAEAIARLEKYTWPGNVRELKEVIERAAGLAGDTVVKPEHLLLPEYGEQPETRLERLEDVVHRHVLEVLTQCSGNKVRASEVLGISRSTLYRILEACVVEGDPGQDA